MRACESHWTKMREAIELRGLSQLVADTSAECIDRVARSLDGEEDALETFDPLLSMHWNFCAKALERVGVILLMPRQAGDGMPDNFDTEGFNHYCPLCLVRRDFDRHNTDTGRCGDPTCRIVLKKGAVAWDEDWVAGCADEMLRYAREKGWVTLQ